MPVSGDTGVRWYAPPSNPKRPDAAEQAQRATQLVQETASIEQRQNTWHQLALWNALLYGNRHLTGYNWGAVQDASMELMPQHLGPENIISEIGDAMVAKASSSPLKPTPVPHGASWKVEQAVREIDKLLVATWRSTQSEDACVRAFLDAYISCIGAVADYWDEDKQQLCTEAIFFDQLIIDNRECVGRREPQTIRIRRVLPIATIEGRWGITLDNSDRSYVEYRDIGAGWDVVVEAFRKPDALGPGRHMIAVRGRVIVDEVWGEDWIPVEIFTWGDRLSGLFHPSGVEALVPYQERQNELNDVIHKSQDIASVPRMLRHANTQLNMDEWDNEAGRFLTYTGQAPEPFNWPTNLTDLYQERERNKAAAFSHVGMSEMFANADPPPQMRFDSSAAVREVENMADSRHLRKWTRFQDFRLRVAKMHMRVLARKPDNGYAPVYQSRKIGKSRKIPYAALNVLTDDDYSWTLDADSMATELPASRRETLRDFSSRGMADPAQARRFDSNADNERIEQLSLAGYDDIDRHIGLMMQGEYEAPDSGLTNIAAGLVAVLANLHYIRCFDDDTDDGSLTAAVQLHVQWLTAAAAIQTEQQQAAQQQALQQAAQMAAVQQGPGQTASFAPSQNVPGSAA